MIQKYTFWIYGSGRWAKILAQQFQILYGNSALLNFVTNRDQSELKSELIEHKIENFDVVKELRQITDDRLHFGIVCGQARDNYQRVMKLLASGLNVYVEKPCALSSKEVHEMIEYAKRHRLCLYFSNAFLFNDQINSLIFSNLNKSDISKIKINWIDEKSLNLINNNLKYDVSLTIYEDVLPHVLNIVASILKTEDIQFIDINVERCGQKVKIKCLVSDVQTEFILERNGVKKIRSLEIHTFTDKKIFDFSNRRLGKNFKPIENLYADYELGPLSMSLYDFVSSVEKQKFSEFNNEVLAKKIIELFPKIEERYLSECLTYIKGEKLLSLCQEEDFSYLTSEIEERMKYFASVYKAEDEGYSFAETTDGRYRQLESQLKKVRRGGTSNAK